MPSNRLKIALFWMLECFVGKKFRKNKKIKKIGKTESRKIRKKNLEKKFGRGQSIFGISHNGGRVGKYHGGRCCQNSVIKVCQIQKASVTGPSVAKIFVTFL